jgi:hypothetical protein
MNRFVVLAVASLLACVVGLVGCDPDGLGRSGGAAPAASRGIGPAGAAASRPAATVGEDSDKFKQLGSGEQTSAGIERQALPQEAGKVAVRAADVVAVFEPATGNLLSLKVGPGREEMARASPAGFVEVLDLHSRRLYNPLATPGEITDWQVTGEQDKAELRFAQQFAGAPFRIDHHVYPTPAGLRWEASLKLLEGQKDNRSVQVAWMLPLPSGWNIWGPRDTTPVRFDGVIPQRWLYGQAYYAPYGMMIPLVGAWSGRAGLAVFSPPDIRKTQISFDAFTAFSQDPGRGQISKFEDTPNLRVAHHMIGLRPGKELKLALCLASTRPDWRCVLGHYAASYPELFEPIAQTRKVEGMYGIKGEASFNAVGEDGKLAGEKIIAEMKQAGVTFAEMHASFRQYSYYLKPEDLAAPDTKFICQPHPGPEMSLSTNHAWNRKLIAAGIAPFMYYYNVHANYDTIKQLWPDDLVKDENGRVIIHYQGEPALHAAPDAPYGKHLIEQMDIMIKAYPEVAGFFVDNFSIQMLDFNHDDGVTMIHDKPAYDLNRNHQDIGRIVFEKAHRAGKIVMINKINTIESCRGADMVLAEGMNLATIKQFALACVYRPLFPLGMNHNVPNALERSLQNLLVLGGTPEEGFYRNDAQTTMAYRPLTDCVIGKRYVLEFDPLDLPGGYEGQIFRIDPAAPRAGDLVVVLADLNKSWRDRNFKPVIAPPAPPSRRRSASAPASQSATRAAGVSPVGATASAPKPPDGLVVSIRVSEAEQIKNVTWLMVESSAQPPQSIPFTREGEKITVVLKSVGAAGVLRFSR